MSQNRQIFIVLTGVSGNLGDAVIRRRILEWVRGTGTIHAYLGRTTPGWAGQIALRADEESYGADRRRDWLKKLVFGKGPRAWVFDPGEVPLGTAHLKSEVLFLLIAIVVRLRGGKIIRPPRAVGEYSPIVGWFYRQSARLSDEVLWRDEASLALMKVGKLVPDTAFSEPRVPGADPEDRHFMIVSLRGKRPLPSDAWFEGIRQFSIANGLPVKLVSQVDEDEDRSKEVAAILGSDVAEYLPWGTRSDVEQEAYVRELYRSASIVVSDRLHVLILSSVAGAIPAEAVPDPKPKVEGHFAVAGYPGVSFNSAKASSEEIAAFLGRQLTRRDELDGALTNAFGRLETEVTRIRSLLS
ncbi:polysaccharide pyruvyl transferase family protein [Herbiconiux sp. P18]|uniref:polysaccharide pyruvyl transferase family protein n=1 Tax=Herbiconiux liangxiaofengii TaxID=3342795 RepID=UPI0035B73E82